jgi:hypothetical protein
MNTMTRILTALLTSAALLAPSAAFAGQPNTDIERIPDLLSLFQGDDAEQTASAQKTDDAKADAEKADERDNGEPEKN